MGTDIYIYIFIIVYVYLSHTDAPIYKRTPTGRPTSQVTPSLSLSLTPPSPVMNITHLPDELKLKIISYTSREDLCRSVAPTCTDFHRLAKDATLWKDLTVYVRGADGPDQVAGHRELLKSRAETLESLIVRWDTCEQPFLIDDTVVLPRLVKLVLHADLDFFSRRTAEIIVANCPAIQHLTLAIGTGTATRHLLTLLALPRLVSLSLGGLVPVPLEAIADAQSPELREIRVSSAYGNGGDADLAYLCGKRGHVLEVLDLDCHEITDHGIAAIGQCRNLRVLKLYDCHRLTSVDSLAQLTRLTELLVTGFKYLRYQTLENVVPSWTEMTDLRLIDTTVSNQCLRRVASTCHRLRYLHVSTCVIDYKTDILEALVAGCPRLEHFQICHQSYDFNAGTATLDLALCPYTSTRPFRAFLANPEIAALTVTWGPHRRGEPLIDDAVARLPPKLTTLTLNSYSGFDLATYRRFAEECPALREVALTFYNPIIDNPLRPLITLPELRSLLLLGAHGLTNEDLVLMGDACTRLEDLNVSAQGTAITDAGIALICEQRRDTLRSLLLSGTQLTRECLDAVADLPHLASLMICRCPGFADEALSVLHGKTSLKSVCLSDMRNLSVGALERLFDTLRLYQIDLANVSISDELLRRVAAASPDLIYLHLDACDAVTDDGVGHVIVQCPQLLKLELHEVRDTSGTFSEAVEARLKDLDFVYSRLMVVG